MVEVWHGRHARRDVHVATQSGRPVIEVDKGVVVHVPVGDGVALKPETDVRENLRGGGMQSVNSTGAMCKSGPTDPT